MDEYNYLTVTDAGWELYRGRQGRVRFRKTN